MITLRPNMLCPRILARFAIVLALPFAGFAADPTLLQMVMPDAQVVAGLEVASAKSSAFGQYVLSHFSVNDTKLDQFTAETGFDPRQDVSELVMATNWKQNAADKSWVVAAHGTFNVSSISSAIQANGGMLTPYQGVTLLTIPPSGKEQQSTGVAFFDPTTAVAGDVASVQAAIDRKLTNTATNTIVLTQAQAASAGQDFWFVTLVPLSNFASSIPALGGGSSNTLLAAINQASGGIHFGDTVNISAQAVTSSPQNAQSLVDVLKFLAGLVQLNRQNNPTAGQIATLLDGLQTSVSGSTTNISLAIPEPQLEQLLNSVHTQHIAKPEKVAVRVN